MKTNAETRRRAATYRARVEAADPQRATPKGVGYALSSLVFNLRRLNPSMEIGVIRRVAKEMGLGFHL